MKKRPLTLTAGILGTIFFSVCVLGSVLFLANLALTIRAGYAASEINNTLFLSTLINIFDKLAQSSAAALIAVLVSVVFAMVALALNACAIGTHSVGAEKFKRKKGVIIAAIVFNVIEICFTILGLIAPYISKTAAEISTATLITSIVFIVAIATSTVFYVLDLIFEKKRA